MLERPSAQELRKRFSYDPDTGVIIRVKSRLNRQDILGKPAGTITKKGYIHIGVGNKSYFAHHIAWAMYYGEWSSFQIDHRDGDKSNNRITNLRQATPSQNSMNRRVRSDNATCSKGVTIHYITKNSEIRYRSNIWVDGKTKFLGYFKTKEDAARAYESAAQEHFGEFAYCAPTAN